MKEHQLHSSQPLQRRYLTLHNGLPKVLLNLDILLLKQLITLITVGNRTVIAVEVVERRCEATITESAVLLFAGCEDAVAD